MRRRKITGRSDRWNGLIVAFGFPLLLPFALAVSANVWEALGSILFVSLASYVGYRVWRVGGPKVG